MTLDDIARQLNAMRGDIAVMKREMAALKSDVPGGFSEVRKEMRAGFDASRARDEELRDLVRFDLEAGELLDEEEHRRFDQGDDEHAR